MVSFAWITGCIPTGIQESILGVVVELLGRVGTTSSSSVLYMHNSVSTKYSRLSKPR